jgi:hypothetical protein
MIGNDRQGFDAKISLAKDCIHFILGHNTGSSFYKKFLLSCDHDTHPNKPASQAKL